VVLGLVFMALGPVAVGLAFGSFDAD
jgi:hypothetical protein